MKITDAQWREAIERAIRDCTTVAALDVVANGNGLGIRVCELQTLLTYKRAQLAQALLGE